MCPLQAPSPGPRERGSSVCGMKFLIVLLVPFAFVPQPTAVAADLHAATAQAPGFCDLMPWLPLC